MPNGACWRVGDVGSPGPSAVLARHWRSRHAPHGPLEWACHSTGIPQFILDLRSAVGDPGASAWLAQPLPMRNVAFYDTGAIPVAKYYEALVYFDHTTPSTRLP